MYTLARADLAETSVRDRVAWALELTVTSSDADAYPPAVFVFQVEDPEDEESRGWFTAVASPAQLLEYPIDAVAQPGEDGLWQPYYRKTTLTLVSRNPAAIEDLYNQVVDEISLLRLNLDDIANLQEGDSVEL